MSKYLKLIHFIFIVNDLKITKRTTTLGKVNFSATNLLSIRDSHKRGSALIELSPFDWNAKLEQKVQSEVVTEKLSSEMHKISSDWMPIIFEHKSILKESRDNSKIEKPKISLLPVSGLEKNTISLLARRISKQISESVSPIRELINRSRKRNMKFKSLRKHNKQIELKSNLIY